MIPTRLTSPPTSPQHAKRLSIRSSKGPREAEEYEIWRRWEDCLEFQRTLEVEYYAVSKRRRKGEPALNHHAKNMLYPSQRAASFESLPLGPDPSTIPVDVHAHIPKLSKKTNLFRMNESVIQQRGDEFKAMIEALFDEDAPSTLQELRTVSTVRDFFGYWRRDREAERKMGKTPAFGSEAPVPSPIPSHQVKGGDPPKPSSVFNPELIAFAPRGSITSLSKPKHNSIARSSQAISTGSREAQHVAPDSVYEFGRPTASTFVQGVSPHSPFSASAAVANERPHRRPPMSDRPVEGTIRADPLLPRSPALIDSQSKMPILDSPRFSSPYTNPPISCYGDKFTQPRQSSSPQVLSAESYSSLLAREIGPMSNVYNNPVPLAHPMQGRTVSMPAQRRHRSGQMASSTRVTDQGLSGPIPRRQNGTIEANSNRSARFFDISTDVANDSLSKSPKALGESVNTGHLQGQNSQTQASGRPFVRIAASQTESYGGSDTSAPSPVQTLLSTGYSTSITAPQSSQRSFAAAPSRHRTVPSWSSRRMSLDSLAPIDPGLYSMDNSQPYITQDPNPRHSVSSDSSYADEGLSDATRARAPSASMPSLILPLKIQPISALQQPTPPPPRPPRSALRSSSTFNPGKRTSVASSPAGSLLTPAEDGGASLAVDTEPSKRISTNNDLIDSYLEMPSSAKTDDPFELEFRAQLPPTSALRARRRANSAGIGHSIRPIVIPPLPPFPPPNLTAPFSSPDVKLMSPTSPLTGQTITIKAIHEASSTILLFRVPRMGTSLADLRAKLSRKFTEAENIQLAPERLELRYLSSASVGPNTANRPPPTVSVSSNGRNQSASVNSTHGADSLWLPLNTEADWHRVAATSGGKVTIKVF